MPGDASEACARPGQQIVADGGFTGVPILFTWNSKGELFAYESDKEAATASRDALQRLLMDIAQAPGVGRVQILAHSMGSWLTMEALRETAIAGQTSEEVDAVLGSGQFGMARETGEELNRAIVRGNGDGLGLGASVGRYIALRRGTKFRKLSLLAAA